MSSQRSILFIGGTGFIGSHLARRLVAEGWRVVVTTRRRSHAQHLLTLPTLDAVEWNGDAAALAQLCAGMQAVVNFAGVLHSPEGQPWGAAFERTHVALPRRIAEACRAAGVPQLIHVSALGAASDAPSAYQRSKAAGEAAVLAAAGDALAVAILRPSVVFGAGDNFINLFARLGRYLPVLPLAGASARLQPVHVGDLVACIQHILASAPLSGTWPVAGPRAYTLGELAQLANRAAGHSRKVIPLPHAIGMLQACFLELLPGPLMSRDNLRSLQRDNVTEGAPLPFGLQPRALEVELPNMLDDSVSEHAHAWRRKARRSQ